MAAYSPISSRNHRVNTAPPYHISSTANSAMPSTVPFNSVAGATIANSTFHGNLSGSSRRRESMNSSIGATSIRRLLTVNRGCRHKISLHMRAKVAKNFTLLIVAHGLMCAVLIPLFGLQVRYTFRSHSKYIEFQDMPKKGIRLKIVSIELKLNVDLLPFRRIHTPHPKS